MAHIGNKFSALNNFANSRLQSYRKAVDSWTIVGLRNGVVKDIRKMIGKMIWGARQHIWKRKRSDLRAVKRARFRK
jgi:hypothetical protein